MKTVQNAIDQLKKEDFTFEKIGEWIQQFDFATLDYKDMIPKNPPSDCYSRNLLCMDPLECILLYWPAGVESAIHYHQGFWGYVAVLKGTVADVRYEYQNGVLKQTGKTETHTGAVMPENDEVIHKICNPTQEELITLHFYYPPLESFDGMQIYDIEQKRRGVLNTKAQAASWTEPQEHFHEIQENAFEFVG